MGRDADAYIVYGIKLEPDWYPKKALSSEHATLLKEEEEEAYERWMEYLPKGVEYRPYGFTCSDPEIALHVPGSEITSWRDDGKFDPGRLAVLENSFDLGDLEEFCKEHEIEYEPSWLLLASYG